MFFADREQTVANSWKIGIQDLESDLKTMVEKWWNIERVEGELRCGQILRRRVQNFQIFCPYLLFKIVVKNLTTILKKLF